MSEQTVRQQIQIARLKKNLCALRRIAGWTMEELGKRIGVTKQTISNLENPNKKSTMTLTQYLAIRSVLDYEAAQRLERDKSDTLLLLAIRKVLDEDLDDDALEEAEDDVALIASAIAGGASSEKVHKLMTEKLSFSNAAAFSGPAAGAAIGGAIAAMAGGMPILPAVLGGGMAGYLGKLFSNSISETRQDGCDDHKQTEDPEGPMADPE